MDSNLPKLTKGQREAIRKIADRQGSFPRVIGERLERDGLAYHVSGDFNFLIGCNCCNCRTANGWVLTDLGQACILSTDAKFAALRAALG
jgi:hypothetical protein